jgi:peptide-methionine (S)-S-oxide reductase
MSFEKPTPRNILRHFGPALLGGAAVLLGVGLLQGNLSAAEVARVIPAPAVDEPVGEATSEVAVFAGGCFWGVQGVFQHVAGVTNAVSGYAGGNRATADYEVVSSGSTGHAESVQVTYDPHKVSYGKLLQVYFSAAHNPTELNRQGPDSGTQYRSAIFPMNDEQARVATAYIAQLDKAHAFDTAIVTKIEPNKSFFAAEGYHQDFLTQHPNHRYIVINDLPKIDDLKRNFPDLYRADPVLVANAGATH